MMRCMKCGAILEDDSKFCTSCGADLEEFGEAEHDVAGSAVTVDNGGHQNYVAYPTKEHSVGTSKIISLIVGTIIIAIGIWRIFCNDISISRTSFGGDFYTYTYRGIVAISELLSSIKVSLGLVIVAIGVAIDVRAFRN